MKNVRWRQGGMSLPELMIALTIGALVCLGGGSLLGIANASYAAQRDAAAVDDGGRYALDLVARAVRQAGLRDWEAIDPGIAPDSLAPPRITGIDAHSLPRTGTALDNPLPDAANGSDVLALRFHGAGPAPDGDGSAVNCAGFPVHATEDGWSIFYVAKNAQGDAELRCKYRGTGAWSADAIVTGVDTFQVLYALDTDTPADGVANLYLNADAIDARDAAFLPGADLAEHTHWKRVLAVRVALVLHGARPGYLAREAQVIDAFGAAYSAALGSGDTGTQLRESDMDLGVRLRERRLFATTVRLR